MQALTEMKPGEICTVKWMMAGAKIGNGWKNIVLQKAAALR